MTPFVRDRFTWLTYLLLPYYAYLQSNIGPMMPFLRDELDLSYTIGAMHFGAFALGMILAGATADRLARQIGRRRLFWGGGAGMLVGAAVFMLGRHPAVTIGSAFVMSITGSNLLIMLQSSLSDHHGANRAAALTEMNTAASVGSGLAPFMVGSLERIGIGWRSAMGVGIVYWLVVWAFFRHVTIPTAHPHESAPQTGTQTGKLPFIFWAYWVVIFLSVSIEWCLVSWGADFLVNKVGLSRVTASSVMSVFFVAVVIGRGLVSQLTRRFALSSLYLMTYAFVFVGFLPFWLAPLPIVSIIGLFIAGLGAANLFPLGLAIASGIVQPAQSDTASGRVALAGGAAILIAPQVLGTLADAVGIASAYGVVIVLLVAAVSVMLWTTRLAVRAPAQA